MDEKRQESGRQKTKGKSKEASRIDETESNVRYDRSDNRTNDSPDRCSGRSEGRSAGSRAAVDSFIQEDKSSLFYKSGVLDKYNNILTGIRRHYSVSQRGSGIIFIPVFPLQSVCIAINIDTGLYMYIWIVDV